MSTVQSEMEKHEIELAHIKGQRDAAIIQCGRHQDYLSALQTAVSCYLSGRFDEDSADLRTALHASLEEGTL